MEKITIADAIKKDPSYFIDVRTAAEFQTEHIKGSKNIPLDMLKKYLKDIEKKEHIIICRTGSRAQKAYAMFQKENCTVKILEGGLQAWKAAGKKTIVGKAKWSLERQVRFTAGLLVAISIILSYSLHPLFSLIALFVGCGLIFAAVTDTCTMGLLLAKLPYNKR